MSDNLSQRAMQADEIERMHAKLRSACQLYCRWYDTGQPAMDGSSLAYELVSYIREALAAEGGDDGGE